MPATAAMDNETLDHLLSVAGLALATLDKPVLSMFLCSADNGCRDVARQGHAMGTFRPMGSHCHAPYNAALAPSQMRQAGAHTAAHDSRRSCLPLSISQTRRGVAGMSI
jgi:hypothetical protein